MAALFFRNVWLKFLSIAIATMLWLVVAGDRVVERALRIPVEYQNLPQGLEIVGEAPESVDVRLRASSGTLSRLTGGELAAVIDVRTARPGRRLFHLTPANITVPYGVEVVQVNPATLPIGFENSAVRVVRVRPSVEGSPVPGYEVVSVQATPDTVEVIGPESSLRGLDEAMTEPISIAGFNRSIREVVTIGVADPSVRLRTPQTAEVTVQIVTGASTRTLSDVPIQIRNLDNGWRGRIIPAHVSVTVRGTQQGVREIAIDALEASVDASGLAAGDHDVSVRLRVAQGLTLERVEPETVRLRIARP
jgi:YbbR domain-containing protein